MNYEEIKSTADNEMKEAVKSFEGRIANIKAGRASESVLDGITFSYFGNETPINQAATITIPEARLLVIKPWDKSNIGPIEKAILKADIGINPQNDGEVIRLPFPTLTEDRRKEYTKEVSKYAEDAKVSIRNKRRDAMDDVKKSEKSGDITEDDRFSLEEELQNITDKSIDEVEKLADKKNKELLTV
ncbi:MULTISPECIES: ribosome recycling factor [Anaerococcus]|jgi:ribosome recycling factor|uniref:Ribosome-recycling factor n=1 Tax=Anaerococcus octavius TaxID=54007 RepID=A0A2I1M6R5_9FIRM|nr:MULTISPECIES: ribosome recycling factor [Anaerococcus]MBS6106130.1 ribosome recycling factor [Anaerococcus sp.]MDU2599715.1 ribosome recycling factor [Anaerococcus sp.]MDU3177675.1 ribosome recycling factor [Anaerococcus sp.]MDU4025699.1 ribosome recycling factor [Anaerococcus sp.]MDU5229013.1 ribosome recycling factor [Anaerococcus sp.]